MNPTRRSAPRAPRTNSVFIFQQGDIQAELRAERTLGRLLKKRAATGAGAVVGLGWPRMNPDMAERGRSHFREQRTLGMLIG